MQVALFGGARLKSFAAGAANCDLVICWMNLWFHYSLDPHYRQLNASFSKQTMIGFKPYNVKLAVVAQPAGLRGAVKKFRVQISVCAFVSGKLKLEL